jgi:hypothetical protein
MLMMCTEILASWSKPKGIPPVQVSFVEPFLFEVGTIRRHT